MFIGILIGLVVILGITSFVLAVRNAPCGCEKSGTFITCEKCKNKHCNSKGNII